MPATTGADFWGCLPAASWRSISLGSATVMVRRVSETRTTSGRSSPRPKRCASSSRPRGPGALRVFHGPAVGLVKAMNQSFGFSQTGTSNAYLTTYFLRQAEYFSGVKPAPQPLFEATRRLPTLRGPPAPSTR